VSGFDVISFDIKKREGRNRPYRVRWAVAGRRFEKSFRTKALADHFRAGLMNAARAGEVFDLATGRPESESAGKVACTWYEHARAYAEMKWPNAAAKSRRAMSDALATITVALVDCDDGMPPAELLRVALYGWAFNPSKSVANAPPEIVEALRWMGIAAYHGARVAGHGASSVERMCTDVVRQPSGCHDNAAEACRVR
jgi:hypothetical protein